MNTEYSPSEFLNQFEIDESILDNPNVIIKPENEEFFKNQSVNIDTNQLSDASKQNDVGTESTQPDIPPVVDKQTQEDVDLDVSDVVNQTEQKDVSTTEIREKEWNDYNNYFNNVEQSRAISNIRAMRRSTYLPKPAYTFDDLKLSEGLSDEQNKKRNPYFVLDTEQNKNIVPYTDFNYVSKPIEVRSNGDRKVYYSGKEYDMDELIPIQVQAFQKGVFYDENNNPKPVNSLSSFDRVVFRQNPFDGNWEAHRTSWMSDPEVNVRSIFGYETFDKGTWGGLVVRKTIGGTKSLFDGIGWITHSFNNLLGVDDPTSQNLFYNIAKSMEYNTPDEKTQGTLAFHLGNVFDGVGQVATTLLPMKILPPIVRKMGASYESSFLTALYTSRAIMSASAGGATTKMLIEMGLDQKTANLYGGWATGSAYLSESILPGNFAEKAAMSGKINQQVFQESIEEYLKKSGIILNATTSNISKRIVIQNYTKNFFSKISNMSKSPYMLPIKMAGEEMPEELLENVFNLPFNKYTNALIYNESKNVLEKYKDDDVQVINGRTYLVNKWSGIKTPISHERGEIIRNEKGRALKILEKESWLDEGFNPEEAIYAGLSSLITGIFMIPSHVNAIKDSREAVQKNTDISYLTYQAMTNKDGLQKIRSSLDNMRNMGMFSKYETTIDGKPVHKGEDTETIADVIINQFMQQIDLHVKAMNTYGITQKEAVEAFENNIDIFRNVNIITTKLFKLQNAINNGIENNVDGELILDTDTAETLQKKHDELYKEFEYYAKPEQGKKRSNAFNDMMFDVYLTDNYISNLVRDAEISNLGQDNYNALSKEEKQEFERTVSLKKQAFVNVEGKINDISMLYKITQEGRISFDSMSELYKTFADYYYGDKSKVSNFAKSYYNKINEKLKARGVISDKNIIDDIENNINEIISKTKSPNKISSVEHIDSVVSSLNNIIGKLKSFDITSHSNNNRSSSIEKYNQIKNNLNQLKENIANGLDISGTIDEKLNAATDPFLAEQLGIDPELSIKIGDILKSEKNLNEVYDTEYDFEAGQGFVDVDNLTREQIDKSLNNNNDLTSMFIIDGIDFGFELNDLYERTQGDNIENALGNLDIANKIYYHLQLLDDFLNIEDNVVPKIESDEKNAEASPNFNNDRPRFGKEKLQQLRDSAKTEMAKLEELIEKLKVATGDKKYGQEKRALMDLSIDLNLIKLIQSYHTSNDKIRDELVSIFVETNDKILSIVKETYPNEPFDEQKYGSNAILYLVDLYVSEDAKKIEKREAIMSKINDIENVLLIAKSKYSGKLGEHIEFLKDKLSKQKKENINKNDDFVSSNIFDYESKNIDPSDNIWNSKNFYDSLLDVGGLNNPNTKTKTSIEFTTLSKLNIWSNAGRNGIPTLKSIYDALREVDVKIDEHLATMKAGDSPYLSYVETHEQEEVLVHMIVSTFNKNSSDIINEDLFKNSIYVRGYAGAGKTTVVLSKYIQAVNELTNKGNTQKQKLVVKILTPSINLMNEHKQNRELLKLIDNNIEFEYITFSEYASGTKGINFMEDIVIVDEASMIGDSKDEIDQDKFFNFIKEGQKNSNTKFVYLGDDSQINHITEDAKYGVPISKYISNYIEKTIPLTETHRGLVSGINQISNIFRELGQSVFSLKNMKSKKFLFNENFGVDINETMQSVETKMADYIKNNEKEHGDFSKFSIIVEDVAMKDFIISKYGKSIENNIFLLKYNTNNEKEFLSGLSSEQVFVYYDFDSNIDKIQKEGNINKSQVLKQEYDKILTAVSRARHKVVFKWNNSLMTSEYNENLKVSKQAESADAKMIEYQQNLKASIERREKIVRNMQDKVSNEGYVSSGTLNSNLFSFKPVDETSLNEATKIANDIISENNKKNVTTKLSSVIYGSNENNINRLRTTILRDIVKYTFIEDEVLKEEALTDIRNKIDELKSELEKEGYKPGDKFAQNYLDASLHGPSVYRMANGNPIIDSKLIYNENNTDYSVTPTVMTVVGQVTENGVVKPIVDIYEVVSYSKLDSPTKSTEEMIVKTIKAAIDNGFIVNNVQVSVFSLENSVNVHKGDFVYGANEISEIISNLNLSIDFTHGFSTKEMYFNIEREVYPTSEEEMLVNKDNVFGIIEKVTLVYDEKGGYSKMFHVNEEGVLKKYTETEFKENYISISEKHKLNGIFNGSALIHKEKNSFYSTTRNTLTGFKLNNNNIVIQKTLSDEEISNIKNIMYDLFDDNTIIEQRLIEDVSFVNKDGIVETHPFAIVNMLENEYAKNISKLISGKIGIQNNVFFSNGLDIISIAGLPEIGYTVNNNGVRTTQTVFSDDKIKEKFIDYVNTGNESSRFYIVNRMDFSNISGENNTTYDLDSSDDIKNFNIAKLEMFRKAKINQIQNVAIETSKHHTSFNNKPLSQFMDENSERFNIGAIESDKPKDGRRKITMIIDRKESTTGGTLKTEPTVIYLRATNVLGENDKASNISQYLTDLINELAELNNNFNTDLENLKKETNVSKRKYSTLASKYYVDLKETKAHRFLVYNRISVSKLLSVPDLIQNIYNEEKSSLTAYKTIKDNVSLLKNILSQLSDVAKNTTDDNQIRVLKELINPPYYNSKWDTDVLEVINGNINDLSLYLKEKVETNQNTNSNNLTINCKPKKRG